MQEETFMLALTFFLSPSRSPVFHFRIATGGAQFKTSWRR